MNAVICQHNNHLRAWMSRKKIALFINVIIILRHAVRREKDIAPASSVGPDGGFGRGSVRDDLCSGRRPNPGENEGVCRCTDIPNHDDIINESATQKKFCLSGTGIF
jgi:hypothetical protein